MDRKFSQKKRFKKYQKPSQNGKKSFNHSKRKDKFRKNYKKKGNDKGKPYSIQYSNEQIDKFDVEMEDTNDVELMKIGKYWDKKLVLETKNTSNKIYISEDDQIYSLCDNTIKVLNYSDLSVNFELKLEGESFTSFCRNEKRNEVIACTTNSQIRVFDLQTKTTTKIYGLNKTVGNIIRFDPTSKFFAVVCSNGFIHVYEYENGNIINNFQGHTSFIHELVFNPDQTKFVFYTGSEDGSVRAWDIVMNKCLAVMNSEKASAVRCLAMTNDGKTLISATRSGVINLWKVSDYTNFKQFNLNLTGLQIDSILYFSKQNPNTKQINSLLLLGCDEGTVIQFNFNKTQTNLKKKFLNQAILYQYYNIRDKSLFLLTQDQFIIKSKVDLFTQSITDAIESLTYPAYCQEFLDVKILPHNETQEDFGKKLIFASNDNYLKFMNLSNNRLKLFEGHKDFIMNIDIKENLIATCSKDGSVRLWVFNFESEDFNCKNIFIFKGHSEIVNSISLGTKNQVIVSGGKDLSIKLWSYSLYQNVSEYFAEGFKPTVIKTSSLSEMGHDEEISIVKLSPNEKLVATAGYDKVIKVWDRSLKLQVSLQGHKRAVTDVSYNKYAKLLASASTDKQIRIWNLNDGNCINTLEGHLTSVLRVFWVYYGTHLLSSGADGLLKFWNVKSSECINTLPAHEGKIWAIDLISGENFENQEKLKKMNIKIFSAGTDSNLFEWNDVTKEKEAELLQQEEEQFQKKEILSNYIYNREFLKALKLALEMDRKRDFMNIFKEFVESKKQYNDHINMIITNRKILEEEKYESEINYDQKIKQVLSDKELLDFFKDNLTRILSIVRDVNIISSSFIYSQILLKILLLIEDHHTFSKEGVYTGEKNKGMKHTKNHLKKKEDPEKNKIDFIQNFEIIKSYSEKHCDRINRELMRTYLIDHTIEKMKLV